MNRRELLLSMGLAPLVWKLGARREIVKPVAMVMPSGLGVGIPWQLEEANAGYSLRTLGTLLPPWWMSWKYDAKDFIFPQFLPMVWAMKMNDAANRAQVVSWYGPRLWLLGNEPERADQSDTLPAQAADMSRWWADAASGAWAGPGVLLGLQPAYDWLDAYLAAGGRIPDAWAVHNYAWTPDQFDGNLAEFMAWMRRNKVERHIIVSECASWASALPAQVEIMQRVGEALEAGRIIAACWYASFDPFGILSGSDLLDANEAITILGERYKGGAIQSPPVVEPIAWLPVVTG